MGFFRRNRNPQSGANSFSTGSSGQESAESDNLPTVNLTGQHDAVAGGADQGAAGGGSSGGGAGYAGHYTSGLSQRRLDRWSGQQARQDGGAAGAGTGSSVPQPPPSRGREPVQQSPRSTSPNNLILLIERGEWNAAAARATSHPDEVRQLVKLRKTTRNASVTVPPAGPAAAGVGQPPQPNAGVQISNVKCKALHHACQKRRSVHTAIYQRRSPHGSTGGEGGSGSRRLIEEDEYVEACRCILALIRVHPEAARERESRHGCLPLHLAVFSMCPTPPPPPPSARNRGGRDDGINAGGGDPGRPPVTPSSAGQRKQVDGGGEGHPLSLPKGAGHHKQASGGSADFSLGNISQLMQQEMDDQEALSNHRESTRGLAGNGGDGVGATIEEQINRGMDQMERLLIGLETQFSKKSSKKSKGKSGGSNNGGGPLPKTRTEVVGSMTPMDSLEERSRETDSHSGSPSDPEGIAGQHAQGNSTARQFGNAAAASAAASAATEQVSNRKSSPERTSGASKSKSDGDDGAQRSAAPSHDELQRRYLQINAARRDESTAAVLDALLDAWPRSARTASEGGRLPLHMACFGRASVRVMETLLTAYPDAARQRNHDGFLPVHIAAHWGVSHPDVAPLLLRAYPDGAVGRNRWERTPIEEALGMAGENGRENQLSLVWSLRRHPTYWIHNDVGEMMGPGRARCAPWRLVEERGGGDGVDGVSASSRPGGGYGRGGGGAVDVGEVGSSDEEDEG